MLWSVHDEKVALPFLVDSLHSEVGYIEAKIRNEYWSKIRGIILNLLNSFPSSLVANFSASKRPDPEHNGVF